VEGQGDFDVSPERQLIVFYVINPDIQFLCRGLYDAIVFSISVRAEQQRSQTQ
jgi:hypothetical protein